MKSLRKSLRFCNNFFMNPSKTKGVNEIHIIEIMNLKTH